MMSCRKLERVVCGFSNHPRIQMLTTLTATPELDVMALGRLCGIDIRTASQHTERLARAGLVRKRSKGRRVLHTVSPRGREVLRFLRSLQ
jgi:DNA-binding MarR family transcriptional regulator